MINRLKFLNSLMLWLNVTFRVLGLGWACIAFGKKMNYYGLEARVWCVTFLSPVLNPKLYSCPLPFDIAVLSAKEVEYVSPPRDWIWPCGLIWPIKQKWWCANSKPRLSELSHISTCSLVPLTWTLKNKTKHKKLPRPAAGPKKDEMQSCLNQAAQPNTA